MQISKSNAFLNNFKKILRMSEKSKTLSIISLNELIKSLISQIAFKFPLFFKCSMQISKSNAFLNNSTQILRMSEKSKTLSIISLNELTK